MRRLSLLAGLLVLLPLLSKAEFIGIFQAEFQPFYSAQNEPLWCWASSASMVMAYQGVPVPQVAIVQHIKNAVVNATASDGEIVAAVNYVFNHPGTGGPSKVVMSGTYVPGAPMPTVLYNQLKQKRPVIMMYQHSGGGHAVVVTGVNATIDATGLLGIDKVYVFDPFSYRQTSFGLQPAPDLAYREYAVAPSPFGVALFQPPTPAMAPYMAGVIRGMILMNSNVVGP